MKKVYGMIATVGLIIALALVCGCTSTTEPEMTELKIGYQPSTHQVAYMVALDKGWWEEDLAPLGITKITDYEFPTGAPEMQAMLAGDIDVAYVGAAPVLSAMSTGLEAKIVAAVQTQGSNLMLSNDLPYEGPEDLIGLRIATYPPGTIQDTQLRSWLTDNGLTPDVDVDVVSMTSPGAIVTAMIAGQVEGAFLPHPGPTEIELQEAGRSIIASGDMDPNHACCVVVVSQQLIDEHPDVVEQIVKTHIRATEYSIEHPDEAAEIYAEKTGKEVEIVKKSFEDWDGSWVADPNLIKESVLKYSKIHYELGYIGTELTEDDLFDTSFYDAVQ